MSFWLLQSCCLPFPYISADKDEERCLLDILCMIFIGFGIFLDILLVLQNYEMPWLHIVRCRCSHTGTEQGFYLGILHWLLLELSYACAGHDVLHHSLCAYIFLHCFLDASWKSGLTFPDFKLLSYICIPKVFFYVIQMVKHLSSFFIFSSSYVSF